MGSVLDTGNGYSYLSNPQEKWREAQCVTLQACVLQCYLPPPSIAWKIMAGGMHPCPNPNDSHSEREMGWMCCLLHQTLWGYWPQQQHVELVGTCWRYLQPHRKITPAPLTSSYGQCMAWAGGSPISLCGEAIDGLSIDFILQTALVDFILSVTIFYRSKSKTVCELDKDYTMKSIHIPPQLGFLVFLIP